MTFHLADSAALQLQLCSPSVVRIWFSPDGKLQRRNASFAVINEELEDVGTVHVNEQAADRLACIVSQMQEAEGVTEELKARDQLAWVGGMNSIRSRAEEIILSEMIFV